MQLDLTEIEEKSQVTVSALSQIAITNNEDNAKASTLIRGVKGLQKTVKETFRPHIEAAHKAWKALIAEEKKHLEPLERAESIVEEKIKEYLREEEKKRIEAQRKADEEAKKEAEKERARLEKQAEKLANKGKGEEAQEKLQEAAMVNRISPIIESQAQKQEGIHTAKIWKFRITNDQLIPREFLVPDESKIRKYVSAMKDSGKIAGVEIYFEEDLRVRV